MVKSDQPPVSVTVESLPVFLLKALSQATHDVAMVDGRSGEEVTFNRLILTVKKLALGLNSLGVEKGDIAGIYAYNSLEYVYSMIASMLNAAVPAMVNPSYKTYEMEHILKLVKAKWWFTTSSLYKNLMSAIERTNSHVKGIVLLDTNQSYPNTVSFSILINHPASTPNQVPLPRVEINPKVDPACILFSSGTTGFPKAVLMSHYNVVCSLNVFRAIYGSKAQRCQQLQRQPQSVVLIFLPIFHAFGLMGLLLHGLAEGHKVVILPRFIPDEVFGCIEKYKVTMTALVPPVMVYMCKNKDLKKKYDFSSLRTILCGAAPLSKDIEKDFVDLYIKEGLSQGYGMTETTLAVLVNIPGRPVKEGSTGQVVPNSEVAIKCPDTNKELGPHQTGEICVKSEQVMLGYLNDPEATRRTIDPQGWLHTGDIGYYDDDGYFFVIGRIKELIKCKGFQVAPAEIERLLLNHPSVGEVAVVGIPDQIYGEVPKAFVVKKRGHSLSAKEVADYVASRLSNHKHLRGGVDFLDSIPKTESGKFLRRKLIEMSTKPKSRL